MWPRTIPLTPGIPAIDSRERPSYLAHQGPTHPRQAGYFVSNAVAPPLPLRFRCGTLLGVAAARRISRATFANRYPRSRFRGFLRFCDFIFRGSRSLPCGRGSRSAGYLLCIPPRGIKGDIYKRAPLDPQFRPANSASQVARPTRENKQPPPTRKGRRPSRKGEKKKGKSTAEKGADQTNRNGPAPVPPPPTGWPLAPRGFFLFIYLSQTAVEPRRKGVLAKRL